MKNSVLNLLRGGVFLLAVIAAFAFTNPLDVNQTYWAYDEDAGLVQVEIGTTNFDCNDSHSINCLFYDDQLTEPAMEYEGRFELIAP